MRSLYFFSLLLITAVYVARRCSAQTLPPYITIQNTCSDLQSGIIAAAFNEMVNMAQVAYDRTTEVGDETKSPQDIEAVAFTFNAFFSITEFAGLKDRVGSVLGRRFWTVLSIMLLTS
jgi:hypothetical protein